MDEPCIIITPVSGHGWAVSIDPTPEYDEEFVQYFESHRKARGFALGLRLSRGFRIVDDHEWLSKTAPSPAPKSQRSEF